MVVQAEELYGDGALALMQRVAAFLALPTLTDDLGAAATTYDVDAAGALTRRDEHQQRPPGLQLEEPRLRRRRLVQAEERREEEQPVQQHQHDREFE